MNKLDSVLKEVLGKVEPSEEEIKEINGILNEFVKKLHDKLKGKKIDAEIFIGGSFAKKTIIKKDHYDVDIFVRYNKKYSSNGQDISKLTKKALDGTKNLQEIHGSRDYFRVKANSSLFIEVIPVIKVGNPKEAENITDLSYSHVKYVNKKVKTKKILDEIRLAKAFCYANKCYGAESYISGFSGYGLELLVYHYKSFLNFAKAIVKSKPNEKIIIDIERYYKNKKDILLDINQAKLNSPIILIDPTYRQRNVLAALSEETFKTFKEACRKFISHPSKEAFEMKKLNLDEVRNNAKAKRQDMIILKATTEKQEGSIAGSKLVKFYRHVSNEIKSVFDIKDSGEEYSGKKTSIYFFIVSAKKEIIKEGPKTKDSKNVNSFRKMHKHTFTKNGRIYAREKMTQSLKEFLNRWAEKNKKQVSDMSIKELRIIG